MIDLSSFILRLLLMSNYLLVVFIIFFEKQSSARRFAWILTLTFFPILGMILYILFSGHFFTKTRRMEKVQAYVKKNLTPIMSEQQNFFYAQKGLFKNTILNTYYDLVYMNLQNGDNPISLANSVTFFTQGKDKFISLFDDIEKATKSIYLQYFIFRNDHTGKKIMDLLCKKANEGLDVRLLYDDLGSILTPWRFFRQLDNAGGTTICFFPIRHGNIWSLNFRNHRKIAIIDEKIAYTGGYNIGDEYAGLKNYKWRDTHVRLTGTCVLSLNALFLSDWFGLAHGKKTVKVLKYLKNLETKNLSLHKKNLQHKKIQEFQKTTPAMNHLLTLNNDILFAVKNNSLLNNQIPVQVISSGPGNKFKTEIKDSMIRMIMSAKKSIYIQTPYFTPDTEFFSVLKIAKLSGIDVRIMVPGRWDKFVVRAAAFAFIGDLLKTGIRFYQYPGFIHAKTMTIDSSVLNMGSCNIDTRSFELHYEANIIFYSQQIATEYENIFLQDQQQCKEYKIEWFENRPLIQQAWWGFCKLFSPIM